MRPSRHQIFMEVAQVFAKRSTCCRLNVGAVIVKNKTIIAHGYNGPEAGAPHCEGNTCEGMRTGCQRAIHAEINAIERLSDLTPPAEFRLTAHEARLFGVLMKRDVCSKDHLMAALYNGQDEPEPGIIKVLVAKIRKKVGSFGIRIDTSDEGYYIPKDGKAVASARMGLDLYVTDSPCPSCFDAMAGLINRVFFHTPYRINDHLTSRPELAVYRILPAGYILDWKTKQLVELEP